MSTMQAVVFHGPYQAKLEERPRPQLQAPSDIIVKVKYSAVCGSELHVLRGHQPSKTGFIMGHEFTGTVAEAGSDVKSVTAGDNIVSPFTVSCGECFYCKRGCSSRCEKSLLYGCPLLDGGQAQYVRIPLADSTVVKAPTDINPQSLVLMADIFPTGFFAARNAFKEMSSSEVSDSVVVVIGCGPVGLCAIINALEYKPKHLLAVDLVESRLQLAQKFGAETWNSGTDMDGLTQRVKDLTEGRGADAVIEVVGASPALRAAFDLLRPWGFISSVGIHNREIPWTGNEGYGKNLKVQMGRCPVRSIFPEALEVLRRQQEKLRYVYTSQNVVYWLTKWNSMLVDKVMPLSQAEEGYELFEKSLAQKVVFDMER